MRFQSTPRIISEANNPQVERIEAIYRVSIHASHHQRGELCFANLNKPGRWFQSTPRIISEANSWWNISLRDFGLAIEYREPHTCMAGLVAA